MYLSRLILNPRSRAVQKDLHDCHSLHRTVLLGFPNAISGEEKAREEFGVLYRLDDCMDGQSTKLLVQSLVQPNWRNLPASYLLTSVDGPNPACKSIKKQYECITTGIVLRFSLRANPTHKVGTTSKNDRLSGLPKSNGRRRFIYREEDQLEWLGRKAETSGFEVLSASVERQRMIKGLQWSPKKTTEKGAKSLLFGSADFHGVLRVTDADRFAECLVRGIGSGKAYGFGLLSVAPR